MTLRCLAVGENDKSVILPYNSFVSKQKESAVIQALWVLSTSKVELIMYFELVRIKMTFCVKDIRIFPI